MLELLNPNDVVETAAPPRFAEPHFLDLGGLGIRDMSPSMGRDKLYILAGKPGLGEEFRIFTWKVRAARAKPAPLSLPAGGNWEGLSLDESSKRVLVVSDDGELGSPSCKDRAVMDRTFRFAVLPVP